MTGEWGFCLKVLVTGCAGFIGSRVSALLSESGHDVIGIDNLSDAYDVRMKQLRIDNLLASDALEWVNSDITNNQFVKALISKVKPDAVINLAARAGVRQSIDNPWVYYETNVIGTLNLLEACKGRLLASATITPCTSDDGEISIEITSENCCLKASVCTPSPAPSSSTRVTPSKGISLMI